MATPLETGIDWGTKLPGSEIHYRFAAGGGVYNTSLGPVDSFDFEPYEIAQFRLAFDIFERYLGVTFVEVSSGEEITLVSSNGDSMGEDTLGVAGPPGEPHQGIAAYNYEGLGWDYDSPGFGALEQGGYGFTTLIHEIGHLLGLAHPHDGGGTSTVFPGVTAEFGDFGDFDLNQGVFTMMSYNDGWQTNPSGTAVDGEVFGFEGTPMAIDIAVLQAKYGANLTFNAGNDTYALPEANALGTFYGSIWDVGGVDQIVYSGSAAATIDLRAATLQVEPGGGGFVSHAAGIFGGLTIARGVVIENAVGGSGDDSLIGNDAANSLSGQLGNDQLSGGSGDDTLDGGGGADRMSGGAGGDTYVVDDGGDVVDEGLPGSDGTDTVRSFGTFSLANDVAAKGNIENLILLGAAAIDGGGNGLANILTGNAGANMLDGAGGADVMAGLAGSDTYVIDHVGDVVDESVAGSAGSDTVQSRLDLSLADAVRIAGMVENLTLLGAAISGIGNGLDNVIVGTVGANLLSGGDGNDRLVGGKGKDVLSGGLGADVFDFNLVAESRPNAARDLIKMFSHGQHDRIDLRTIDADTQQTPGNQKFAFIGASPFSGVDGQLRFAAGLLQGDTNGDGTAEFSIKVSGAASLSAGDFVL